MEKTPRSFYMVRFNDCDPLGHLNNGRYIDYFLNAREDHLRASYGIDLKEWALKGIGFVVSQHEIKYIRPVTYNERICIQSSLIEGGDASLLVEMCMFDEEAVTLKAICWTKFTRINMRTGKKETHPAEFMDFIQQVLWEGADPKKGMNERIAVLLGKS